MAAEGFSLTKLFSSVVKGATLIAITEVVIFTLVHTNPAWMAVMSGIAPHINSVFDATGITNLGWGLADAFGAGPTQLAANVGGSLVAAPGGGSMLLPPMPGG